MVVVISNILNFLAERVLRTIPVSLEDLLVVHMNKTPRQVQDFKFYASNVLQVPAMGHGDILDILLKRKDLAGQKYVTFVDHDVIFPEGLFTKYQTQLVEALEKNSHTFLAAQKHEFHHGMLCPYVFRTVPMFVVRPSRIECMRFSEQPTLTTKAKLWDAGQHMANRRPEKITLIDEWTNYNGSAPQLRKMGHPFDHWTSFWMNGRNIPKHILTKDLMELYPEPCQSDIERMRSFTAFRNFYLQKKFHVV